MKFDSSAVINIINILIALAALILTINQNNTKELSYEVIYSKPIIEIADTLTDHNISILFDGKTKSEVFATLLKIKNTGDLPIDQKDLAAPIAIKMNKDIYSSSIIKKTPDKITASLSKTKNKDEAELTFNLLNENDNILIEIITENGFPIIELNSHIKDAKNIIDHTNKSESDKISDYIKYYMAIILLSLSIVQTFLLRSWFTRNKTHDLLKFSPIPYWITYFTLISIKIPMVIVLAEAYSNSSKDYLIVFFIIYSALTFSPELIFILKTPHTWVNFPSDIGLQRSNLKKRSSKKI